jgi:hypothetical protein
MQQCGQERDLMSDAASFTRKRPINGASSAEPETSSTPRAEKASGAAPYSAVEDTDLERRVLAHERILQCLIVHMTEAEPKFLARMQATFSEPMQMNRREHDFTDTDTYAEQFIERVARLSGRSHGVEDRANEPETGPLSGQPSVSASPPQEQPILATRFVIRRRTGVWEVTKDGRFFGDYVAKDHAVKAAETEVQAIVAAGGSASSVCTPPMWRWRLVRVGIGNQIG